MFDCNIPVFVVFKYYYYYYGVFLINEGQCNFLLKITNYVVEFKTKRYGTLWSFVVSFLNRF